MRRPTYKLLVYGSGGHGKVVADAALAQGWKVVGFADDNPKKRNEVILDIPIVAIGFTSVLERCQADGAHLIVALGDNQIRKRVFDRLCQEGIPMATVIHPNAVVARSATVGAGSVVFAGAVVNPASYVGDNVIINTAATVDHDNVVGDHAQIAPGVHTGGTVSIGEGAFLGVGASVRNNVTIGAWSLVGVGAVVVGNIPERVVAYGNPARVIRPIG